MAMDPNKRGNPPFEPSSYAAGLERRLKREAEWRNKALDMARTLLGDGSFEEQGMAADWWREQLNPVEVVLSTPPASQGE